MLLSLRKILFYIILILYLTVTPYLILYGLGYVFKAKDREILKTGLVSVVSEPKGATVYIEGRKFSRKTPAIVRGLLPGTYQVRVARKGFDSWSKKIQIFPEKATRLEPVILIPKTPEREALTERRAKNLFLKSGEFKILVLAEEGRLIDLLKIDLLFKKEAALHQGKDLLGLEASGIVSWISKKDSNFVLFKLKSSGEQGYLLYDLEHERIAGDLTGRIPENSEHIDWDSKRPKAVYFLKNHQIRAFNFLTQQFFQIPENEVLGFSVQRRKIYFIKKDFSFWESNLSGEEIKPFAPRNENGARVFSRSPSEHYQLEMFKRELFQKEQLLFKSSRGALFTSEPPYLLVDGGVRCFNHAESGDGEKILYWTRHEIGVFDFSSGSEEDEVLPLRMVLYRSGTDIKQVFWAYENSHIIFRDKDEAFLLEAGDQAPYLLRSLQTVAPKTDILYHDKQKILFYLDSETKKVMKRKITE